MATIETDKATVEYEMQEEGYIAKILFPEGAKDILLGTAMAILVENKEDVEKFKDFKPDSETPAPPRSKNQRRKNQRSKKAVVRAPSRPRTNRKS